MSKERLSYEDAQGELNNIFSERLEFIEKELEHKRYKLEKNKIEICVVIIIFLNSILTSIYLNSNNILSELIWFLPIISTSTTIALLLLSERKIIIEKIKNPVCLEKLSKQTGD